MKKLKKLKSNQLKKSQISFFMDDALYKKALKLKKIWGLKNLSETMRECIKQIK